MITIPADVPQNKIALFKKNYLAVTKGTEHFFLFTGDQKLERLALVNPDHIFTIAASPFIGAFAAHLGLIARYGKQYPSCSFIAKLNGKSGLVPQSQKDPISKALWSVDDAIACAEAAQLSLCGVGYTVYLGSEFESDMLKEAAQIVHQAHQNGLLAVIWMYPRGKAIANDLDGTLIAGAASAACCLGADFVKIKAPQATETHTTPELLQMVVRAAGNTKVLCAGGEKQDPENFLAELRSYLEIGGISGCAIGRNVYENDLEQALIMAKTISTLVYR